MQPIVDMFGVMAFDTLMLYVHAFEEGLTCKVP